MFGLSYWYYVSRQVRTGTTFGKKLFNIYVISEKTGEFMTRKQALIRLFGYVFSYVMVGCGFLMVAFHPRKQAFHDLMAGTLSVRRFKK